MKNTVDLVIFAGETALYCEHIFPPSDNLKRYANVLCFTVAELFVLPVQPFIKSFLSAGYVADIFISFGCKSQSCN